MTLNEWLTLAAVIGALALLVRDAVSPAFTVLGAVVLLLLTRVLTTEQALSGFGNAAPLTVAALYIIARGVQKTGGLQGVLRFTVGEGQHGRRTLSRLLVPTASISAIVVNTPLVAMLVGPVTAWAERRKLPPSRFLMPFAFAVTLGGLVTVIGNSTNLLVSGLMESSGMPPIGFFEITPVGFPVAVVGVLFLIAFTPVILKDRSPHSDDVAETYREFAVQMTVAPRGPLDGRTVEKAGLRHLEGVFLVEMERGEEREVPVPPTAVLRAGDRLTFVGRQDDVVDLHRIRGLVSTERTHMTPFDSARHVFLQAVVGMESGLVGTTLREARFRERYQAAVVAIHRAGQRVLAKLGTVPLRPGDTLVLLTDPGFAERWRDRSDFLMVSQLDGAPPAITRKAWIPAGIMLLVVISAATGVLPLLHATLLGAVLTVVTGVLTPAEARAGVNLDVVLLIVGSIGLGRAVLVSGLGDRLATGLVRVTAVGGAHAAFAGVVVATMLLTELIGHSASAALMFPIALSTSGRAGMDPRAFALSVAVAASSSFLTPIGHQVNMMVYGPGGYRFRDYTRLGTPLAILVAVATIVLGPLVWPF